MEEYLSLKVGYNQNLQKRMLIGKSIFPMKTSREGGISFVSMVEFLRCQYPQTYQFFGCFNQNEQSDK